MRAGRWLGLLLLAGCGPIGEIAFFQHVLNDDNTKPDPLVVVESGPPPVTNSSDVALTFAVNTPSDLEGRLQPVGGPPAPFAPVGNPLILSGLADGEYVFTVRVASREGYQESSIRFRVDTRPPTMAGEARIVGVTDTSVLITWDEADDLGAGVVGYRIHYSLDAPPPDAAPTDFTGSGGVVATIRQDSPANVSNVTTATISALDPCRRYFVGVSAVDAAGNESEIVQAASRRTGCGGNGAFELLGRFVAGAGARALVSGDFNADRLPDLAVLTDAGVAVLLGNGDGTFQAPRTAAAPGGRTLRLADFNADGIQDLVDGPRLYLGAGSGGRGDGSFAVSGLPSPGGELVGDFNGDGIPDLVFATETFANTPNVFLHLGSPVAPDVGRGTGTFATVGEPGFLVGSLNFSGRGAVADFDDDRIPDLALLSRDNPELHILSTGGTNGRGDGTFGQRATVPVGALPVAVATADFNRDGATDLAVTTSPAGPLTGNLRILLSKRDRTFTTTTLVPAGVSPVAIAVGDFNSDALPDVVVVDGGGGAVDVYLAQDDDGVLAHDRSYAAGPSPSGVCVADFDADGILDVATADAGDGHVTVLRGLGSAGRGTGVFVQAGEIETGLYPRDVIAADLNGDGIRDIAAALDLGDIVTYEPPTLAVYFGNGFDGQGDGTFRDPITFAYKTAPESDFTIPLGRASWLAAADFDGDGILDVAANRGFILDGLPSGTAQDLLETFLFKGLGTSGRANGDFLVVDFGTSVGRSQLGVADFDRDGLPGIARLSIFGLGTPRHGIVADGAASAATHPEDPDLYLFEVCDFDTAEGRRSVAPADFNADGVPDLATTDAACDEVRIWLGHPVSAGVGDSTFVEQTTPGAAALPLAAGDSPSFVLVGDFNDDAIPDLVVALRGAGSVAVFLGNGSGGVGDGTFTRAQTVATGAEPEHIVAGDFTGDRIVDLAVANRAAGTVSLLRGTGSDGQGDGQFVKSHDFAAGTRPFVLAVLDANSDRVPDLLVGDQTERKIRLFLGVNELE